MDQSREWSDLLRGEAGGYARAALANIKREFPAEVRHIMSAPGDFPYRPRARTPVFYGSYNWHSSVQMHWLLVRLLRAAASSVPAAQMRAALGTQFTPVALAAETDFVRSLDADAEAPYGFAWALALVHEAATWDDPDARKWAAAMEPLREGLAERFLGWLAGQSYPVRDGTDENTALALMLAWPFAQWRAAGGEPALLEALTARAEAWFGSDSLYPADWEPSGHDLVSPALAHACVMSRMLPATDFAWWLSMFLPGLEWGRPASLFTPVTVPETPDSKVNRLHGLNATRAWCWRRITAALPDGDNRADPMRAAASQHAKAVLPCVLDGEYTVEHWLASYAVLMLT